MTERTGSSTTDVGRTAGTEPEGRSTSAGPPLPADPTWDTGSVTDLPCAVYLSKHGTLVEVGPGIERLTGTSRDAWLSGEITWEQLLHPADRERVMEELGTHARTREPYRSQYRILHRSGGVRYLQEEAEPVEDDDGGVRHWLGFLLDITDLVETKQELWNFQARYGALVEQIPAVVYVDLVDEATTTIYVSPRIEDLLGVTPQEDLADPTLWERMLHPEDREETVRAYLEGRQSGEAFELEYRMIAKDGHLVWIHDSALVITDERGKPALVQGVQLDITARKEAEERITYLAYHDELTGLANRARFDDLLDRALSRARRAGTGVAVLSVDIDDFQLVNDSLGHAAGDELLRRFAERLQTATRETDLVARHAGDEFLVWLADLDHDQKADGNGAAATAELVAERIHEACGEPFRIAGTELFSTVSIGVSLFPDHATDPAALLGHSNAAMHASKPLGPGRTMVYAPDAPGDSLARLSMTTRLRRAVERQDWLLHYQPVVDIASGAMIGVEALVRWLDPDEGLVPPNDFIPLAEDIGLIEAIGSWVVEEIARQDARWCAEGLELDIAFNLSPRQLRSDDVLTDLLARIDEGGADPRRLTVEITESTAMTDPERTIQLLNELHGRGLRLAIDDFGSGYSSLARLKEMPVDVLKIDRSLVSGIDVDPAAGSMVSAMISLAASLSMVPLAEGVETDGEWRFLAARGCALGQGFLFSRPVPGDEILTLHRSGGTLPLPEVPGAATG